MGNELATRNPTLKSLVERKTQDLIVQLPKSVKVTAHQARFLAAVARDPKLAKCTPDSLALCYVDAVTSDLTVGGAMGQVYLIPYGNEAQFTISYRGLVELARRSGDVKSIYAKVVTRSDEFDLSYEPMSIRHKPDLETTPDESNIIGAYMVATMENGERCIEWMTKAEIDKVRAASRASGSGPWKLWYAEMAKKSVTRRGLKHLPLSVDMIDAIERDREIVFDDPKPPATDGRHSFASLGRGQQKALVGSETPDEPNPPVECVIDSSVQPGDAIYANWEVVENEPNDVEHPDPAEMVRETICGVVAEKVAKGGGSYEDRVIAAAVDVWLAEHDGPDQWSSREQLTKLIDMARVVKWAPRLEKVAEEIG